MSRAFGIDISKWNSSADGKRKMDFEAVKNHSEPVLFIAARTGISYDYLDPLFSYYWKKMKSLKVARIAYHVLHFGADASRQMDHLFYILDGKVNWAHDRIALDLEVIDIRQRAQMTRTTLRCIEICQERTGRLPIAYSRANWVNTYLKISDLPQLDWWLAHYNKPKEPPQFTPEHPGPPVLPHGVSDYLIHQTAEKAKTIGGVGNYMDYNRWNGDENAVASYFGKPVAETTPPEQNPPGKPDKPEEQGLFQAMCMVSTLYKYTGPSSRDPIIGKLSLGDVVTVFEELRGWYRLHHRDSVWTQGKPSLMRRLDKISSKEAPLFSVRCIVPAQYKRVGPGKEHRVVGNLVRDDVVHVYEERSGWFRIAPDAQIWVNAGRQYLQRL